MISFMRSILVSGLRIFFFGRGKMRKLKTNKILKNKQCCEQNLDCNAKNRFAYQVYVLCEKTGVEIFMLHIMYRIKTEIVIVSRTFFVHYVISQDHVLS